jgi:hypothetical protein
LLALTRGESRTGSAEGRPAGQPAGLTRQIESAYLALRHTLLQGRVLRSCDRPGLEQETWALLTLYQLLRMAMTDATQSAPGTDPDRASFTTALQAATDQLIKAHGIIPGPPGQPGVIARTVLAGLLPARRPRYSARKVKNASRYPSHHSDDPRPALPTAITAVTITITTPPPGQPPPRRRRPRPASRRHRVITLMNTTPGRSWTAHDLAAALHIEHRILHTQLGRWARTGHLIRTNRATYAPAAPP